MSIKILEAEVNWCDPHRANQMSGKYQTDAIKLTDEQVKQLQADGVTVNFDTKVPADDDNNRGFFVKLKSATPVEITDMQGTALPSNLFIGNGSKLVLAYRTRAWTHKGSGRSGVSLVWLGAKVKEFVKYDPDKANKDKASAMLDGVSGEGFTFGEGDSGAELGEFLNKETSAA